MSLRMARNVRVVQDAQTALLAMAQVLERVELDG
jgi:hypothetical protein